MTVLGEQLYWCNPLLVAEKIDTDIGLVKKRVVLDLSRHVNKYIVKQNFQLDHCCQMAEFWAAGHKNGPVKLLAA
jgi:hypothetical protein